MESSTTDTKNFKAISNTDSISLCICTMNRPDDLKRCLESVFQSVEKPDEVIVSDDSPDPEPTKAVVEKYRGVIYQPGPRRGLGPNRNACIRSASGSHIIFIDGEYFRNPLPKFSDCPDPSKYESMQFRPNADGHIFLFHEDELKDLAKQSGLSISQTIFFNNPLTCGHLKLKLLTNLLPSLWINSIEKLSHFLPLYWRKKLLFNTISVLYRSV